MAGPYTKRSLAGVPGRDFVTPRTFTPDAISVGVTLPAVKVNRTIKPAAINVGVTLPSPTLVF